MKIENPKTPTVNTIWYYTLLTLIINFFINDLLLILNLRNPANKKDYYLKKIDLINPPEKMPHHALAKRNRKNEFIISMF